MKSHNQCAAVRRNKFVQKENGSYRAINESIKRLFEGRGKTGLCCRCSGVRQLLELLLSNLPQVREKKNENEFNPGRCQHVIAPLHPD